MRKSVRSIVLVGLAFVACLTLPGCGGNDTSSAPAQQNGSYVRSDPSYGAGKSSQYPQQRYAGQPAAPGYEQTGGAIGAGDSDGGASYSGPSYDRYVDSNPPAVGNGGSGTVSRVDNSPSFDGVEGSSTGSNQAPAAPQTQKDPPAASTSGTGTGGDLLSMPLINQNTGGGKHPEAYCGPTSVRMVLAHYGIEAGADEVALTDFGSGAMYRKGDGSTHEGMNTALRHYGLQTNFDYSHNLAALRAATQRGHPVIVNLEGDYGPFYTNGHIVVVVGFTAGGDPIINDSAGGVQRTIPRRTFVNCWQGLAIEAWK